MCTLKRRKLLKLLGLSTGAALLPTASRAASTANFSRAIPIAQGAAPPAEDPFAAYMRQAEAAIAKPFKGITTDGKLLSDLYSIQSTEISTEPVRRAADAFIAREGNSCTRNSQRRFYVSI
ncbi:hypothetical protein H6F43_09425 [Leptolyngbya sp. FACHB-36]|uniref:hypothetical protein n=1 Tax=Leptolyngbya sp. FACHB-36 TaxID=2692808 RepID=UPI0016812157|nr:hypothetical protein [Leptolyngbya sp. FACHB-36]MBD2020407.1 hypothetical protein [Leptolyngbya sp. FACHB-36]